MASVRVSQGGDVIDLCSDEEGDEDEVIVLDGAEDVHRDAPRPASHRRGRRTSDEVQILSPASPQWAPAEEGESADGELSLLAERGEVRGIEVGRGYLVCTCTCTCVSPRGGA